MLHRLNGKSKTQNSISTVTPNEIATQLVLNSQGSVSDLQRKKVNKEYNVNFRNCPVSPTISAPFSSDDISIASSKIESGKASGLDNIYPDFLKHLGPKALNWLARFFTSIHLSGRLPREWKKARVFAVLKPNKAPNESKNYRPITLLSCCYKLFERCLTARIGVLIDAAVPKDQAGFRKNRSCCDQVIALTNFIELGFDKELKTGVVFLDLSAAFDTVWKKGLMLKLSRIIPCRQTAEHS